MDIPKINNLHQKSLLHVPLPDGGYADTQNILLVLQDFPNQQRDFIQQRFIIFIL